MINLHLFCRRFALGTLVLTASLCLACSVVACGDEGDDDAGNNGGNNGGKTGGNNGGASGGQTACFTAPAPEMYCQAGQFCEDSDLRICADGCLADNNCASNQTCDKSGGGNVGTCQNTGGNNGGTSLEAFCDKIMACDSSVSSAMCEQVYNGVNETCRSCVAGENCPALNDFDNPACARECGF